MGGGRVQLRKRVLGQKGWVAHHWGALGCARKGHDVIHFMLRILEPQFF